MVDFVCKGACHEYELIQFSRLIEWWNHCNNNSVEITDELWEIVKHFHMIAKQVTCTDKRRKKRERFAGQFETWCYRKQSKRWKHMAPRKAITRCQLKQATNNRYIWAYRWCTYVAVSKVQSKCLALHTKCVRWVYNHQGMALRLPCWFEKEVSQ